MSRLSPYSFSHFPPPSLCSSWQSLSLSVWGAPNSKAGECIEYLRKHTARGPHKGPRWNHRGCWFITRSLKGLMGTKTCQKYTHTRTHTRWARLCDGCSSNLLIAEKKWNSFKWLSASESRSGADKNHFYGILSSVDKRGRDVNGTICVLSAARRLKNTQKVQTETHEIQSNFSLRLYSSWPVRRTA